MEAPKTQRQKDTFIIEVMGTEFNTWQGQVIWANAKRKQYFRSALELLKLIDSAVEGNGENRFDEELSEAEAV